MKHIRIYFALIILSGIVETAHAQYKWWGGYTINQVVEKSDFIFEGRILSDSGFFQVSPGEVFTLHRVLVLKKFKGKFTSDTFRVVTWGGRAQINGEWERTPNEYAFKGDEAVFFATNSTHVDLGGSDSTTYCPFYGPGVSYVTVCNKKDVVKEVYEPIEKATGVPMKVLRKNSCEK